MWLTILSLLCLYISSGAPLFIPEPSSFSIDTALRSLSKAVFTHAILPNDEHIAADLAEASLGDTSECIKKLICIVHSIPMNERTWTEQKISEAVLPKLEFQSQTIQLQLAAKLGRAEPGQCPEVYSRCPFDKEQLVTLIRQRGMSLNIPTSDDYDCTVIFLWKKRENQLEEEENSNTFPVVNNNDLNKPPH